MQKLHLFAHAEVRKIASWREWLAVWDTALRMQYAELFETLLHSGFHHNLEIGHKEQADRVIFYLDLAEGHTESYDDTFWGGHREHRMTRFQLARKAFDVLAARFFGSQSGVSYAYGWDKLLAFPEVQSALLNFFRTERVYENRWVIKNLWGITGQGEKRYAEMAEAFVPKFASYLWYRGREAEAAELLYGLERIELFILETPFRDDAPKQVGEGLLGKLRAYALDHIVTDEKDGSKRKAESVEEAAAFGNKAAQVLLVLYNRNDEFTRRKLEKEAVQI